MFRYKSVISILLIVCLLIGCVPAWATESEVIEDDFIYYSTLPDDLGGDSSESVVPIEETESAGSDVSGSGTGTGDQLPVVDVSQNSIMAIADAVNYEGVQYENQIVLNIEQGQQLVIDTNDASFMDNYDCAFLRRGVNTGYFVIWPKGGDISFYKNETNGMIVYPYSANKTNGSSYAQPVYKSSYGFLVSFEDASAISTTGSLDGYGIEFATTHIIDYRTNAVLYTSSYAPPITYKVEFNTGVEDLTFNHQRVENAAAIVLPELVDVDGYITATGWYLDEDCTLPIDTATYTLTSDITLYANYIAYPTVTFVTAFYDLVIESQRLEDIRDFVYPEFENPEGYEFVDWYTDVDFREVFNPETYVITGDFSLYGKFEPVPVVSFVTGFDDLTIESQYANNLDLPRPKYEGYSFIGWFIDEELSTPFSTSVEITEDITLYAKFAEASRMEVFVSGILDGFTELFETDAVKYLLAIFGLVIVFGCLKVLMSFR